MPLIEGPEKGLSFVACLPKNALPKPSYEKRPDKHKLKDIVQNN